MHTGRRTVLLVVLPVVILGCGSNSKRAVARIEADEITTRCGENVTASEEGKKVSVYCHLRGLTHLTGTLWRARITFPGGCVLCVTFDAAKYVPGSTHAQNAASCT